MKSQLSLPHSSSPQVHMAARPNRIYCYSGMKGEQGHLQCPISVILCAGHLPNTPNLRVSGEEHDKSGMTPGVELAHIAHSSTKLCLVGQRFFRW
jgi:hypothetical protein